MATRQFIQQLQHCSTAVPDYDQHHGDDDQDEAQAAQHQQHHRELVQGGAGHVTLLTRHHLHVSRVTLGHVSRVTWMVSPRVAGV